MCLHSSLNQTYWSDMQHGLNSVISNTCVYIHHEIRNTDLTYNMVYIVLSVKHVCTCIIKTDILIWHATWWNEGVQEKYKKKRSMIWFWNSFGTNQVKRNVCCLNNNAEGWEWLTLIILSKKQIKVICKIINIECDR